MLSDMRVPPELRLGRFDIDLGLPPGGGRSLVQTNYMMTHILSSAISTELRTASKHQCGIVLSPASYPLIEAYMSMPEASSARDQVRRVCVEAFRRTLSVVESDDSAIREAIDELKARDTWARGSPATPQLRNRAAISEAIRGIYDEDSTVHALLSIRGEHYAAITVAQFRQWMGNVRRSGQIRLLTDDPQLAEERDFERDINAWHEIPTPKKSADLIELNDLGPVDIRAAVLVAIKPSSDGKVRNDVVERYCRHGRNTKVDSANKTSPRCIFSSIFRQEDWISFYYLAEDGPDESLRRLAADIAQDPAVRALAAMKQNGGRSGHPYLVFFSR